MNIEELEAAKLKYKQAYTNKEITKIEYLSARKKINLAMIKLDPNILKQRAMGIDEFAYNINKKLGYSPRIISKFCHMNLSTIEKKIQEYQEKVEFEEYKKSKKGVTK